MNGGDIYHGGSMIVDNLGNLYVTVGQNQQTSTAVYRIDSNGNKTNFIISTLPHYCLYLDENYEYLYAVVEDGGYNIIKYEVDTNLGIYYAPISVALNVNIRIPSLNGTMIQLGLGDIYYFSGSDPRIITKYSTGTSTEAPFSDLTLTIPSNATVGRFGFLWDSTYSYVGYTLATGDYRVIRLNTSDGSIDNALFIAGVTPGVPGTLTRIFHSIAGFYILIFGTYGGGCIDYYNDSGNPDTRPIVSSNDAGAVFLDMTVYPDGGDYYILVNNGNLETSTIVTTKPVPEPPPESPLCFKEGSKILCLQGTEEEYVEVQNIRKNMLVKTSQSGYKRVDKVGTTVLYNDHSNKNCLDNLYICKKEEYPELTEDLIMTGSHSILVDSMTPKQKETTMRIFNDIYVTENKYRLAACIDSRAKPYDVKEKVNIWHLSLEHTNKFMNYGIYANGLLVESASKRMMGEIAGMKTV